MKIDHRKLKIMLQLRIVSPEKVEYDGAVESVLVPGTAGQFEILNDHAPIISTLQKGVVEYATKEGKVSLNILGGFVEVQKNVVSLCVEIA
jgi:F-type H+-transporting ATPase subunit epsilon